MRHFSSLLLLVFVAMSDAEENWTQFRGPNGDGMSAASQAPIEWNEDAHLKWKTPIPGQGWSSPVSDGKFIWLTTAIVKELSQEDQDRIREERFADHMVGSDLVIVDSVQFRAVGVEVQTGRVVHDLELFEVKEPLPVHSLNSYASPTPVLSDGRLYCHFGSFGTVCLDTTTQSILWRAQLSHYESVGPGSSPALYDRWLIIPCDGIDTQYVAALDIDSGKQVWRTDRPAMEGDQPEFHKSFSTPTLVEHEGRKQAVILGAQWIVSYAPDTGEELWRFQHSNGFSNAVRPVYGDGQVIFTTGFFDSALVAVDPGGSGDVTDTHLTWRYQGKVPTMSSPILVGQAVYFVSDGGVAECIDVKTGERIWRERLGGNFSASPIHVGGNLYFGNRDGQVLVIAASEAYQEIATNELDGSIMASPAMIGEDLIIRTDKHLYRIFR